MSVRLPVFRIIRTPFLNYESLLDFLALPGIPNEQGTPHMHLPQASPLPMGYSGTILS
jgi:hypothetical protein